MDIAKKDRRLFFRGPFLMVAVLAVMAFPVYAQTAPSSGLTAEQMQELQQLQQEMQTVGQQLDAIQQTTLEASPELQAQQEHYRELLIAAMQKQGADPEPVLDRMGEIQEQLKDEDLDEEKRQQLINTYREKDLRLQRARQEAMQDEEVRKAAEDLSQATLGAMREQDPKTEDLLREVERLRQQMQSLMAAAREESGPQGQ